MNRHLSFTLVVAVVALSLIGLALLPTLPFKLVPTEEMPEIDIAFSMQGQSPRFIEQEVTSRLEAHLNLLDGVSHVSSLTQIGKGSIRLQFDKHVDLQMARFKVSSLLRQVWGQLPEGVSYPRISMKYSEKDAQKPLLTWSINAVVSTQEVQDWVNENLIPVLGDIEGVERVEVTGARPMEWRLTYDADQLATMGIDVPAVKSAISEYCSDHNTINLNETMLFTAGGNMVPLKDLLTVQYVESVPQNLQRINGLNAIYLSVYAAREANQIEVGGAVKSQMSALQTILPQGYETHLKIDATAQMRSELGTVLQRTFLTLVILIIFVAIVYRNWRYVFLMSCGLAANLSIAFIFYWLFGLELHIYSLAGISVSLSLIIDNMLMMTDHQNHRSDGLLLSMLAATLTSIGSLMVVYSLSDEQRLNLYDFASVICVNLGVSLAIAYWFIPALSVRLFAYSPVCPRMPIMRKKACYLLKLSTRHEKIAQRVLRSHRWLVLFSLVGLFVWACWLFAKKVTVSGCYSSQGEPVLSIHGSLPNGTTIGQMDHLIRQMEATLSQMPEVRQFQSNVSQRDGSIEVFFKPEYQSDGSPYEVKDAIISRALQLGGGSWSIGGLDDMGFTNDFQETAGRFAISFYGYDYDQLWIWAEKLKQQMSGNRRIRNLQILPEQTYYKTDDKAYFLISDSETMSRMGLSDEEVYAAISPILGHDELCGRIWNGKSFENVVLGASQASLYDVFSTMHQPLRFSQGSKMANLSDMSTIEQIELPQHIIKKDQQYQLVLQFGYVGPDKQGERLQEEFVEAFRPMLPMGFSIKIRNNASRNRGSDGLSYISLLYIIAVIYVICAVLFNSLTKSLIILLVIPVSFIGVFLIFLIFHLHFNQGGYAAFVLLSGITVNASIYLIRQFEYLRNHRKGLTTARCYVTAWNQKITPISLTVLSTVLGFAPFLFDTNTQGFWFPLAAATIGGLLFSMAGLFLILPLFLISQKDL